MTKEAFVLLNVVAGVLAYLLVGTAIGAYMAKRFGLTTVTGDGPDGMLVIVVAWFWPILIVGWLIIAILARPVSLAIALGTWLASRHKPGPAKDNERAEPAIPLPPPPPRRR